jgi:cob(I)alamin adenosyltransferase
MSSATAGRGREYRTRPAARVETGGGRREGEEKRRTSAPIISRGVKIYTKTGDSGETSLFDNTRVSKADPRVDAYGEVDELNAVLGVALAAGVPDDLATELRTIQKDLFALGARLADPSERIAGRVTKTAFNEEGITRLEACIDRLDAEIPALRRFILPGGSPAGALLHLARTVCRRAERRVIGLGPNAVEPAVIIYLNRLSDLLFTMARAVNHRAGMAEIEW